MGPKSFIAFIEIASDGIKTKYDLKSKTNKFKEGTCLSIQPPGSTVFYSSSNPNLLESNRSRFKPYLAIAAL